MAFVSVAVSFFFLYSDQNKPGMSQNRNEVAIDNFNRTHMALRTHTQFDLPRHPSLAGGEDHINSFGCSSGLNNPAITGSNRRCISDLGAQTRSINAIGGPLQMVPSRMTATDASSDRYNECRELGINQRAYGSYGMTGENPRP